MVWHARQKYPENSNMKGERYCELVGSIELHRGEIMKASGISDLIFDSWMLGLHLAELPAGYNQYTTSNAALTVAGWLRELPGFAESASRLDEVATTGITWS